MPIYWVSVLLTTRDIEWTTTYEGEDVCFSLSLRSRVSSLLSARLAGFHVFIYACPWRAFHTVPSSEHVRVSARQVVVVDLKILVGRWITWRSSYYGGL